MSTLSLHSLQMSSCTLRRHIAHWGGQSQNYKNSQVSIHIVGTLAEEGVCRQRMRIERSEHVGKVHWANIMFPVPQNRRYKNSKGFLLSCVQRRQHEDGTFDCDIWFRLLFEPPVTPCELPDAGYFPIWRPQHPSRRDYCELPQAGNMLPDMHWVGPWQLA